MLAGGGTGGHVYPALALADALRRRDPAARVLFVGSAFGMEASLVPRAGVPFAGLAVRPPRSRSIGRTALALGTGAAGLAQAAVLVVRMKPDAVVATGGVAAAPPVLAAWALRVPVVLLEGNAALGRTNALLARFARVVAVTSDEASARVPGGRGLVTGLPVRPEVYATPRSEGLRAFGLDPRRRTILVLGGSQGAATLNAAVDDMVRRLSARTDLQILHQTGRGWSGTSEPGWPGAAAAEHPDPGARAANPAAREISGRAPSGLRHIRLPYFEQIGLAYACADLVVSRCGATSIAEITACGLPAVLVPYRYAAEGHQTQNAMPLAHAGAGIVVADDELTGETLAARVLEILDTPGRRDAMAARSKALGRPDASERVLALLEQLRRRSPRDGDLRPAAVSKESGA
ncbi:MAG TPA: undecaprenyldiphospho-muramoylpentapeptide beta-N-acetylglucosaminyltransferase [bacterium]|nr:undecaprenyldiphospho-muramoylpentapeptide beta-N-acetylglucosaminyltransferase [bacterium]